jgi:hypothetical protein
MLEWQKSSIAESCLHRNIRVRFDLLVSMRGNVYALLIPISKTLSRYNTLAHFRYRRASSSSPRTPCIEHNLMNFGLRRVVISVRIASTGLERLIHFVVCLLSPNLKRDLRDLIQWVVGRIEARASRKGSKVAFGKVL